MCLIKFFTLPRMWERFPSGEGKKLTFEFYKVADAKFLEDSDF